MHSKVFFKGLNGLRFIAAALVLFSHSEKFVFPSGVDYNPIWYLLRYNGDNAVSFFFVLSGFLISYLLLTEIRDTGDVSVKKFYLKRIVRIWPIYYLLILGTLLVIPFIFYLLGYDVMTVSPLSAMFYILIMPNVSYIAFDTGKLFHLWSIGVEEQFYLIWAPLVKVLKKYFLMICSSVIIIKLLIVLYLDWISGNSSSEALSFSIKFLQKFRIEQMALGGIGAYLIFHFKEKVMSSRVFSYTGQAFVFALLLFFITTNETHLSNQFLSQAYDFIFNTLGYMFIPLLFLYIILNVSLNDRTLVHTENTWMNYLGQISYGFYVYHFIAILAADFMLRQSGLVIDTVFYAICFWMVAFVVNVIISGVSYQYFEKRFLKYRPKD